MPIFNDNFLGIRLYVIREFGIKYLHNSSGILKASIKFASGMGMNISRKLLIIKNKVD